MATLTIIFLVSFLACMTGAVMLIKIGGWLAILSAILILIYYFVSTGAIVILGVAELAEMKKKKMKEQEAMYK